MSVKFLKLNIEYYLISNIYCRERFRKRYRFTVPFTKVFDFIYYIYILFKVALIITNQLWKPNYQCL